MTPREREAEYLRKIGPEAAAGLERLRVVHGIVPIPDWMYDMQERVTDLIAEPGADVGKIVLEAIIAAHDRREG